MSKNDSKQIMLGQCQREQHGSSPVFVFSMSRRGKTKRVALGSGGEAVRRHKLINTRVFSVSEAPWVR